MRVYHFLSTEYALADIALRRLKIARLTDVNDPFEFNAINVGGKKEFRKALNRTKRELSETKGLLCFSKKWHEPVMWSHYAHRHHGMCLGFDFADKYAKEVTYSADRIMAEKGDTDDILANEELMASLLFTKYKHWAYEEEVRAYVDLDPKTREDGIYYYTFSDDLRLREVILGPLCALPIERVRSLVSTFEEKIWVMKTRLAFKFFRVVEDERFKNDGLPTQTSDDS